MADPRSDTAPGAGGPGTPEGATIDPSHAPVGEILAALPGAPLVIDEVGTVRWASPQAGALVGRHPTELVGVSVLEFVTSDSAWAYASAAALAADYPDVTMGPLRIAYLDGTGERRDADLWATNQLDNPRIGGIVCMVTEATAAAGMAEAVSAVAAGQGPAAVAELVAMALRGAPVSAEVTILADVGDTFTTVARTPGAPVLDGTRDAAPWHELLTSGIRQLYNEPDALPADLAAAAGPPGFVAAWVEPVVDRVGPPAHAAIVIWKQRVGSPSPNQLSSIHEAAAILALAYRT